MSVAMKKLDGVESVDVSLERAAVDLKLRPGNHVSLDDVRRIVLKQGFTPREAEVKVAGTVTERGGRTALAVSGSDLVYLLTDGPNAKGRVAALSRLPRDKPVTVEGAVVVETQGGPATLAVLRFE